MLFVVISMLVILAIAGLVVLYVAYPHRGEQVPAAPWLGDAMSRAVDAAPLLEPEYEDSEPQR
ncbi:hypothetical protein GCM10027062_34330 [Nocardioides hungaricus]